MLSVVVVVVTVDSSIKAGPTAKSNDMVFIYFFYFFRLLSRLIVKRTLT